MWDLSFSALNEDSGFWPRLQRRCYGGFRRLSGLSQRFWLSRAYFPFLLWVALGFAALRQPVYGAMALLGICIWLLVFCRDLLASVTPFLLVFLLSTQRYESLGDFLPCAVLAAPFFAALIWHLMVWPVTFRVGRSATGLLLVSAATLLGGCGILSMHQLLQPLSLYYAGCLGGGMLVFYVLLRSCLTYSKGYDLHRRFAAIFCALGVCMACLLMLDYAVRWQEFLQVHTTLYLKYRNFATALLLTTLPMSFYLSLKKPAHLLGVAVQAAGLALTGSRSALLFGVALLGLGFVYLVRWGLIPRKAVLPLCVAGAVLAVLVGPELLSLMMDSRMEDGHLFHQGDSGPAAPAQRGTYRPVGLFAQPRVWHRPHQPAQQRPLHRRGGEHGVLPQQHRPDHGQHGSGGHCRLRRADAGSYRPAAGRKNALCPGAGSELSGDAADLPDQPRRVLPLPQCSADGDGLYSGGGGHRRRGRPRGGDAGASAYTADISAPEITLFFPGTGLSPVPGIFLARDEARCIG